MSRAKWCSEAWGKALCWHKSPCVKENQSCQLIYPWPGKKVRVRGQASRAQCHQLIWRWRWKQTQVCAVITASWCTLHSGSLIERNVTDNHTRYLSSLSSSQLSHLTVPPKSSIPHTTSHDELTTCWYAKADIAAAVVKWVVFDLWLNHHLVSVTL